MIKQLARLIAEGSILLLVLLLLKNEVFPFYMSIWYPAGEHAEKMRDLIYLIVGMVTAFVYVGIGSSSRHAFQLSFFQSATVFFFWHSPFIFAGSWGLFKDWQNLLGDLFALLFPGWGVEVVPLLGVYFSLFLLGRFLHISEPGSESSSPKEGSTQAVSH